MPKVREDGERGTNEEVLKLSEKSLLVRSLDLQSSVLRLDVRDIIRDGLPRERCESVSQFQREEKSRKQAHVQLNLVAHDLRVGFVQLEDRSIDVFEHQSYSLISF